MVEGGAIAVGTLPIPIAISFPNPLEPPASLTGSQKKNDFALVFEFFNELRWTASPSDDIAGYFIYRNGAQIATLSASTFEFEDHNREKGVSTLYSITSFDSLGSESDPIEIQISPI